MFRVKNTLKVALVAALLFPLSVRATQEPVEGNNDHEVIEVSETVEGVPEASNEPVIETQQNIPISDGDGEIDLIISSIQFNREQGGKEVSLVFPEQVKAFKLVSKNGVELIRVDEKEFDTNKQNYTLTRELLNSDEFTLVVLAELSSQEELSTIAVPKGRLRDVVESARYLEFSVERFQFDSERLVYSFTANGKSHDYTESFDIDGLVKSSDFPSNLTYRPDEQVSLLISTTVPSESIPTNFKVIQSNKGEFVKELEKNADGFYLFNMADGNQIIVRQLFSDPNISLSHRKEVIEEGRLRGIKIDPDTLVELGPTQEAQRNQQERNESEVGTPDTNESSEPTETNDKQPQKTLGQQIWFIAMGIGAFALVGWLVVHFIFDKKGK